MTLFPFALTPLVIPPDLLPAIARRHRETVAVLVRRVVARAVADHRRGVLERVCDG